MSYWTSYRKNDSIQKVLDAIAEGDNLSKLTTAEAREVADRLRSAANKRMKRLRETGVTGKASPALRGAEERIGKGKKFTTKGKNRNQLLSTIADMRDFMEGKTSTARGWKRVRRAEEKRIGIPKRTSERKRTKFWGMINRITSSNSSTIQALKSLGWDSARLQRYLREQYIDNHDVDEDSLMQKMQDLLQEEYDQMSANESEYESIDFDDLDDFDDDF